MNLSSYLSSWWINDPAETPTAESHHRFMAWMADPKVVKTEKAEGWENYRFDFFREDMAELWAYGLLHKAKDWPKPLPSIEEPGYGEPRQ